MAHLGSMLRKHLDCANRIFVDNEIKKKWLEGLKFRVVNLMEYGYNKVNLPRTVTTSENHDRKFRVNCAIHNVKYMKKFYYTNFDVSGKRLKIGQVKTILEVMGGLFIFDVDENYRLLRWLEQLSLQKLKYVGKVEFCLW